MTTIYVAPDLFYHRWEQSDGELWIGLRAFVLATGATEGRGGDLKDFDAWAKAPHTGDAFTYADQLPGQALACRLPDNLRLVPVMLPSDLDVWVQIIRGPTDPTPWVRISRSKGCKTSPDVLTNDLGGDFFKDDDETPSTDKRAFAWWFNEQVRKRYDNAGSKERERLAQWLELRMECGDLVDWTCGDEITDLFRDENHAQRPPLPIFRPSKAAVDTCPAGTKMESNLYWLSGLMSRIGKKPSASFINDITAVNVHLVSADKNDPQDAKLKIQVPLLTVGAPPQPGYFTQVKDAVDVRLASYVPLACDPKLDPPSESDAAKDCGIAYVSPVFRGMAPTPDAAGAWVYSAERIRAADTSEGAKPNASVTSRDAMRSASPPLSDLAGLEVRAPLNAANPDKLDIRPGFVISGRLRPYRRFPQLMGRGEPRATVMVFEPGGGAAALLEAIGNSPLGAATLSAMFAEATVTPDWRLELLETKALPWDGPNPVYRVVARPSSNAEIPEGEPRTLTGGTAVLKLARPQALETKAKDRIDPEAKPEFQRDRWLWRPADTVDAGKLAAFWKTQNSAWAALPINALFLSPAGSAVPAPGKAPEAAKLGEATALDCLFLGDYSFQLADDRLRFERQLVVGTVGNGADGDEACSIQQQPPAEDYEDDLVNFNAARILDRNGARLDDRVRFAQGALANSQKGHLFRRQVIPLVLEWEREPANTRPKPGQEPPKLDQLTWKHLRDFVRRTYLDDLASEPFQVRLEHTYGASFSAVDEGNQPLKLKRSARYGWVVETPTAAETFEEKTEGAAAGSARLLTCAFKSGVVELTLDPTVLDPAALRAKHPKMSVRDAYSLALTGWRSAAEVFAAKSVGLEVQLRWFDAAQIVGSSLASATALARKGASGRWTEAIGNDVWRFDLDATAKARLVGWFKSALEGAALPAAPQPAQIIVKGPQGQALGDIAHVARAHLLISRKAENGPPADLILKPITRQPGLHEISPNSLYSVWAQMGFGPFGARKDDVALKSLDARLEPARDRWLAMLRGEDDSITPVVEPPPTTEPEKAALRQAAALIAELEGTDWFTPEGRPKGPGYDIAPVLLPLGFSTCAPHPKLDRASQAILQRVLAIVRDTVDVSYVDWADTVTDWKSRFKAIAGLATWAPSAADPRDGSWTGPLPELLDRIVKLLLRPQPDPDSDTVAPAVAALAKDFEAKVGQVSALREAALRRLLADPGLFADAKAFLLTKLLFTPSASLAASPPPASIARARFVRHIRPPSEQANGPPDRATTLLGWESLVGGGLTANASDKERLAFLDVLDDAAYDNAFSVAGVDCQFEPFEEMVDPPQAGEARLGWGRAAPIAPAKSENVADGTKAREVRLASRNLATPPLHKWSSPEPEGKSAVAGQLTLRAALAGLKAGQKGWRYDRLVAGLPPESTAGSSQDLTLVALRSRDKSWDTPLPADTRMTYFVYEVVGDEEASGVDIADAFTNDGFFVRLGRTAAPQKAGKEIVFPVLDEAVEARLRRALEQPRGTKAAATYALDEILAKPVETLEALKGLVAAYEPPPLPDDVVLLKPVGDGAGVRDICVGTTGEASRIRDIALFRKQATQGAGGPADGTALLVFGVALDVWTDWHVELIHGRNLPFSKWGANCDPGGRTPASFAPQFWQAVPQTSAAVVHRINNKASNDAGEWVSPRRVFNLPKEWVGVDVPVSTLVERVLFKEALLLGHLDRGNATILDPKNKDLVYNHRLSVTVSQEFFEGDAESPQNQRFAFPSVECANQSAAKAAMVNFSDEYATLSLDFHWFRAAGADPLLLHRIFIKAP